jgi:hypothetical protein
MPAKRPTLHLAHPADGYAAPGERIFEFSGTSDGKGGLPGGLLSLTALDDGSLLLEPYRLTSVTVRIGGRQFRFGESGELIR